MDRVASVALLFLFLNVVTGLMSQQNTWLSSAVSLSKVLIAVPLYVLLIMLLKRGFFRISPVIRNRFLLPALGMLAIAVVHYMISDAPEYRLDVALKEIIRIIYCILLIVCVGLFRDVSHGRIWLLYGMALLGALIGGLSIHNAMTGTVENTGRYVGEILRAGSEVVDSNVLAGILNACSFLAVGLLLSIHRQRLKLLLLATILIAQAGRVMTFSTGGHVSFAISILVATYCYWQYLGYRLSRIALVLVSLALLVTVGLISSGMAEIIFYRLQMSDDYVYAASVGSRLVQYIAFWDLLWTHPLGLLTGFGSADFVIMLGVHFDLHNSYLRSLGTGGFVNFILFGMVWLGTLRAVYSSLIRKDESVAERTRTLWLFSALAGWTVQMLVLPADQNILTWFFIVAAVFFGCNVSGMNDSKKSGIRARRLS